MAEVNIALASGNFPNGRNIKPTLAFGGQLAIQCTKKNILTEPGYIVRYMWACRREKKVECQMEKVPNYRGKWLPSAKKPKYPSGDIRSSATKPIHNTVIKHRLIVDTTYYCFYVLNDY